MLLIQLGEKFGIELKNAVGSGPAVNRHPGQQGCQLNGANPNGVQISAFAEQDISNQVIQQPLDLLDGAGSYFLKQLFFFSVEECKGLTGLFLLLGLDGLVDSGLLRHFLLGFQQKGPFSGQQGGKKMIHQFFQLIDLGWRINRQRAQLVVQLQRQRGT